MARCRCVAPTSCCWCTLLTAQRRAPLRPAACACSSGKWLGMRGWDAQPHAPCARITAAAVSDALLRVARATALWPCLARASRAASDLWTLTAAVCVPHQLRLMPYRLYYTGAGATLCTLHARPRECARRAAPCPKSTHGAHTCATMPPPRARAPSFVGRVRVVAGPALRRQRRRLALRYDCHAPVPPQQPLLARARALQPQLLRPARGCLGRVCRRPVQVQGFGRSDCARAQGRAAGARARWQACGVCAGFSRVALCGREWPSAVRCPQTSAAAHVIQTEASLGACGGGGGSHSLRARARAPRASAAVCGEVCGTCTGGVRIWRVRSAQLCAANVRAGCG